MGTKKTFLCGRENPGRKSRGDRSLPRFLELIHVNRNCILISAASSFPLDNSNVSAARGTNAWPLLYRNVSEARGPAIPALSNSAPHSAASEA
jgi:hypothetical protein